MSKVADMARTYQWLNKCSIKANTKGSDMASQEQALNTRTLARETYHTVQDPKCRLRKQLAETVADITSGCSKLAGSEYAERHNNVTSIVYRTICAEYNLEHSKDW